MSANREDAVPVVPATLRPFDQPVPTGPDPTSDLAEEITSELGGNAPQQPLLAMLATTEAAPGPAAADNVLRDRYVIEARLGAGGSSVVHRAVDLRRDADSAEGRLVAIKILRPELRDRPDAVARLQREFRQSRAAAHPGVVRVFDLDCDRGAWFIVMELLAGEPLGALLRRPPQPALPAAECLRIAGLAADALAHAHAAGVVHGDVKPDNLFLTAEGGLRLLDFGAAPEPNAAADAAVPAVATRRYASPEVSVGADAAPADDVYSLACVTYELLTGALPYGTAAGPTRIGSLDDERWATLDRALSRERGARPSMAEFARGLRGGEHRFERIAASPAVPASTRRGRRSVVVAAAAAILALVLLIGVYIGRQRQVEAVAAPPPPAPAAAVQAPVVAAPPPAPEPVRVATPEREKPPPESGQPVPAVVDGPPGAVYFDAPRMVVSRHAVLAAIPMRNASPVPRPVTIRWRIVEDTARVDRDFGGPVDGSDSFVEGNRFRILYVPILQQPGAHGDRRFFVEMTAVSAGTRLGPVPRVEVTILGGA